MPAGVVSCGLVPRLVPETALPTAILRPLPATRVNMPRTVAFLGVLAAAACSSSPAALSPDQTKKHVQDDVRAMQAALYSGDVDTLLRYTHPLILDRIGTREQARNAMLQLTQQVLARNMKVESLTFPAPPDVLQGGERRFAIVPTLTVIAARDQRVESLNYQLGVLEPGASQWQYVEGSRVNAENVRDLFPDFPTSYQFPKFYRKRL